MNTSVALHQRISNPRVYPHVCSVACFIILLFLYLGGFSGSILEFLKGKGHKIKLSSFSSVIQGIKINQNGLVTAYADSRKDGLAVLVNSTSTA